MYCDFKKTTKSEMPREHLFRCMLRVVHGEQLVKAYRLLKISSKHHVWRMAQAWGVILPLRAHLAMSGNIFVTLGWGGIRI